MKSIEGRWGLSRRKNRTATWRRIDRTGTNSI